MDNIFTNVRFTRSQCDCHGNLFQMDARFVSSGKPVRVMQSREGWHVSIGDIPITPPEAVTTRVMRAMVEDELGGTYVHS